MCFLHVASKILTFDFPGGPVFEIARWVRMTGLIPGPGRFHRLWGKATKPIYHNNWAHTSEPGCCIYWACMPKSLCSTTSEAAARRSRALWLQRAATASHDYREAVTQQGDPLQPWINKYEMKHLSSFLKTSFLPWWLLQILHVKKRTKKLCWCKWWREHGIWR